MAGCYCQGPSSSYILPWTFRGTPFKSVSKMSQFEGICKFQVVLENAGIFSDQWHGNFGGLAPSLVEDLGLKPPVLQVKTLNTSQQTKIFSWHSRKCEWIKFLRIHLCPLRLFLPQIHLTSTHENNIFICTFFQVSQAITWRSSSFHFWNNKCLCQKVTNHHLPIHPFPSLKPAATNLSIKAMATAHRPQRSHA